MTVVPKASKRPLVTFTTTNVRVDGRIWWSDREIARRIKAKPNWVAAKLSHGPFSALEADRVVCVRGIMPKFYPVPAERWIRVQLREHRRVPVVGSYYTLPRAADALGCTREWIAPAMARNGLGKPEFRRSQNNRLVQCISPATLKTLRGVWGQLPPDDWISESTLELTKGYGDATVRRRLAKVGIRPSEYRSPLSGRPALYYPPEADDALKSKQTYPPGGTWMTETHMAAALGESHRWVRSRLSQLGMDSSWRWRLDDSHNARRHYPPQVLRQLKVSQRQERPSQQQVA